MRPTVQCGTGRKGKCTRTHTALEWFFAGMYADVTAQIISRTKRFVTVFAFKLPDAGMN